MGRVDITALDGVDLDIEDGAFVAIQGRSGSGKSTLLHILGALDEPTSGDVEVDGRPLHRMSSRERAIYRRGGVGFVFQFYHLIPGLDALGNVELPLALAGVPRRERRRRAETLLERVGLRDRARHGPAELSGGEQQRVAIARALAHDPRRIFADEPTGNLDSRSAGEIMALLREVHAQGKTILLVTHDAALARAHASRIVTLSDGRVVEGEAA